MGKLKNNMNNKYVLDSISKLCLFMTIVMLMTSCVDKFLPDDLDSLGVDSRFTQTDYRPVLGRNTLMNNNFNAGNASQPLTFKIINIRKMNGDPAKELTENFPVQVWKKPYLGTEKSLEEIENKRTIENQPLFDIREHNGAFEMWAAANSSFVRTAPDSGYVFDVEVSNSGGRRYFTDMRLTPMKERPYEPSNLDETTGGATQPFVRPTSVSGMRGHRTSNFLGTSNIEVYFRKVVDENGNNIGDGNSIKFLFKDSLNSPIDPNKFALTDWDNLMHGFNMEKTDEYVKYQVAYPIPLIPYETKYTTVDGTRAHLNFRYERLGFGNRREEASLVFDFAIFEKGDWEVIFRFAQERPKFENE
ncbi:DUF5007 domain-containing protein [Albibacterium profundi]|uniref:DUF5007 domain-containing protein n=1 Tax=Albibacterium profundi TaxID=3134906 RepID=A0ABV5CCI7_9SPHI